MDLHDFPVPACSNFPKFWFSKFMGFPKLIHLGNALECSWVCLSILVSPKINNIGLGAQVHVSKSRNHENEGVEEFPIMKSKSY